MFGLFMHPRCLLQSLIDNSSSYKEESSSYPYNVRGYSMVVNNDDRFSHDLALVEIPGFDVPEPPTTWGTSSEI